MDSDDPLKDFLQNTGWSCDELLQKLLQIKSKSSTSQETIDETAKQNSLADSVGNSQTVTVSKPKPTSTSTNSNVADKDFSDTDDEEKEVISTNKHIIEEIIEDISDDKPKGQKEVLPLATKTKDCEPSNQDVGVIELDSEEEEDDNFEEDCWQSSKKTVTLANTGLSKEKSNDEAEKSKVGPNSTIVIEDDEIADTDKRAVSSGDKKNDSSELNEVLASVSLIRTDSVDKTSTDDDLEVLSIEDVYDNTDLQKQIGPIHVVSLGESNLSAKKVEDEVEQKSVEKVWQLPTIAMVEGGIDSTIKSNPPTPAGSCDTTDLANNKKDLSSGSTGDKTSAQCSKKSCVNEIVQSRSSTERTEIGKTSVTDMIQHKFSNIDSNQSITESLVKKDALPVPKGITTFGNQISPRESGKSTKFLTCSCNTKNKHSNHSTKRIAGETDQPPNRVDTDFEDVIQAYVLNERVGNNLSQKKKQSSLVPTAEQKKSKDLQRDKQKISTQKPANSILSVSKKGKTFNKNCIRMNHVPSEIASVEAERNSAENPPFIILMIEHENNAIAISAESCPTESIDVTDSSKQRWQLPKILSVEGAVEVDQIQTGAEEFNLLKNTDEALLSSSSQEDAHNTTSMTTVNKNRDLVTKGLIKPRPRTVEDPPQFSKTVTDSLTMDGRAEDCTSISECSTGKLTKTDHPKPLQESSELSSTVNNSEITDDKCQDRLKTVEDSTVCSSDNRTRPFSILLVNCLEEDITKSESPKKDVNQNQDPAQSNTTLDSLLDSYKLSLTVRKLDDSLINITRDSDQVAPKTFDDSLGLPEESTDASTKSSINSKAGVISDSVHSEFVSSDKQDIHSKEQGTNSQIYITNDLDHDGQKTDEVSLMLREGAIEASTTSSKNSEAGETTATLNSVTEFESSDKKDIQNQEPRTDSQMNIMDKSDQDGQKTDEESSKLIEGTLVSSTTIRKSGNAEDNSDTLLNALEKAITGLNAPGNVIQNQKSPADDVVQPNEPQEDPMRAGKAGKSHDEKDCSEVTTRECVFRAEDAENSPKSLEKSSNFVRNVTILDDDLEDMSTENHSEKSHEVLKVPPIKLTSAGVEPAANDVFENKDKVTPPEKVWTSDTDADLATSPASAVEEVEYRLVDPHDVDSPSSAGGAVEEYLDAYAVNTLSSSSTEDCVEYAVEALENTSAAEDTNQTAVVELMPEDDSLRNDKGTSNPSIAANAAERNEIRLIRRFDLGVKDVSEKSEPSLRVENNSIGNKRAEKRREKDEDVVKYHLTTSKDESQPRKSNKLSMADIIQRKLNIVFSNESNANEETVSVNEHRNKLLLHRNLPSADCRGNTEPVLEHILETNDTGDRQPAVSTESSASVDKAQHQMSRKISIADIIRRSLDAAPTKQLQENTIDVIKDKITNRLLDSEGTIYPYKHQLNINENRNDLSTKFVRASTFGSLDSESPKVSKSTTLNQENAHVTEGELSRLLKQGPKNTTTTNTDNMDPESNRSSTDFVSSQATNKTDKNSHKDYIKDKGATAELSKESKPSTSTSSIDDFSEHTKKACQEEVVFAVPKLPPLRASSSKNNGTDFGNVETIRMNLKLQLDSLRNRKRQHVQITTKIDDSFFTEATSNQLEKKSMIKELSFPENIPQLQDELYTQTNELGLVILDVQGGVELDDQPVIEETDTSAQKQSEQIQKRSEQTGQDEGEKNEVENLVREIIGKKGEPKIRIRKDLAKPPPVIDDFEIFQKRFVEDDSTVRSLITTDPGPSTSTTKTHDEDMSVLESALFSGENSQLSSSNHEQSLPGSELKSPFVSNTLDEFLTGDAQLNVSYKIPKCGAEEGLRELRFESEPSELVLKKTVDLKQNTEGTMKKVGKKVRTLAQKRKLLEKQMAREKKQREKEQRKERIEKEKQQEQKKLEDKNKDRSYVIEGGKKIWVNSILPKRCIVNIDEAKPSQPKINLPQSPRQKKISLLENLQKKHQVKYAPGPLSKKHVLQVGGTCQWKTEVKSLPTVFVEVVPKLGHPLPPELIGRIGFDATLTSEHIEFALTALKTKNQRLEPDRKFVLPVRYKRNQRQIVVRKKVPPPAPAQVKLVEVDAPKAASQDNRDDDEKVIAKVVDDLINYVEIKELAPSLIKEDDYDFTDDFPVENKKAQVVDEHLSVMKRSQKKRSRVDWELIRLNCKIVNVEVEKEEDEKSCTKPYCRLGCVCKSLRCENTMIFHCQNEKCMFSCNCPKERQPAHEHRVTLPAGTNVLSTDTVTKIEDEAKKHLARVEREFTQTIIQTDNRTIVIGASGRSKTRRAAQVPKKYTDYVDIEDDDVDQHQVDLSKKCEVSLTRLNLDAIIPFCLQHSQYDCFCKCLSDYRPSDHAHVRTSAVGGAASATSSKPSQPQPAKKTTSAVDKVKQKKRANENATDYNHSEPPSKKRTFSDSDVTTQQNADAGKQTTKELTDDEGSAPSSSWDETGESESTVTNRPVRNKKAKKSEYYDYEYEHPLDRVETCARAMKVSRHKRKAKFNIAEAVKNDFVYHYTQADVLKIKMNYLNRRRHLEVDILKQTLLADYLAAPPLNTPPRSIVPVEPPLDKHLTNRKQTLEVRSDISPPAKSQATDSTPSVAASTAVASEKRKSLIKPKQPRPVFEGEIIINESSMELLRKMGPRTLAEGYARLLPWRVLSDSYKSGAINIWCMIDQPSRLLVNKADKKAPKNYVDIRMTTQPTEVIMWILRDRLPSSYQEENVSFILRETKDNFEICGVCTKNLDTGRGNQKEQHPPAPELSDSGDAPPPKVRPASNWLETGLELKHRDMTNRLQSLMVCLERHNLQTLAYEDSAEQPKITARLPQIGSEYKWRLIYLKSDFSYLYFLESHYSVKYMDLMIAVRMGGKAKEATLMLHSGKLTTIQDHPKMGIYFDQSHPNKMFVGPYSRSGPNANLAETMRYVNQKLVSTEAFHKMSGNKDYRSGFWMVETAGGPDNRDDYAIVDLTEEESATSAADAIHGEPPAKKRPSSGGRSRSTSRASMDGVVSPSSDNMFASIVGSVSLTHQNAHIEIIEAPPRKPEEFNRFVITNIPHFGYLGAFKHPTSDKIDVSWPFENKMLRFPTVKIATEFLQERFSALLLPVPETFKIHVIVVNHLDTNANLPIDANVLSGHYICGEFGYYNFLTITPQTCLTKLHRTREEVQKMFAKRCRMIVRKRSETLACLLHLSKPIDGDAVADVNEKAVEEIKKLKVLELHLVNQKKEQVVKKRRLATELFVLLSELPEGQRSAYSEPFKNILMAKQNAEAIEIASDSDEEAVDEEEEEEERGPPVLEAQSLTTIASTTPPFDELPVLEKQVPTGISSVLSKRQRNLIKSPSKKLRVQKQPDVGGISESRKHTASASVAIEEQSMATLTPLTSPPSALQTAVGTATANPRSLLRTSHLKTPPRPTATSTATAAPTAPPTVTSPRGKYLRGIKVVKGPNGQFMIVPHRNVPSSPAPVPVRLAPLPGTRVLVKSKNGGSSAENDSLLTLRTLKDSLTGDTATRIIDLDDMPAEQQND